MSIKYYILVLTRRTTAVEPQHLKVKEDISLTKNYCISISIQKISSVHKFIFKMQQILGFHELTSLGNTHPKIIESAFSFPEFVKACKRSVYSICSLLRYNQFFHEQNGHAHFWLCPPQKILWICIKMQKKKSSSTRSFFRNCQF